MRIIVIGASGFIGQHFCQFCIEEGTTEVIAIDFVKPNDDKLLNNRRFSFIQVESSLSEALNEVKKADAIVNFAGKRLTKEFDIDDALYNVKLIDEIVNKSISLNISNVVVISSISTYSSNNKPWKEENADIAPNIYGVSKLMIDDLVQYYNLKFSMKIKSLRLAQVIGFGERKGYLLNTLIDNAKSGNTISIIGNGSGKRQYIYIKDVIECIFMMLSKPDICGVYNVGIPGSISIIELAELINTVFGNQSEIIKNLEGNEDLSISEMDISRINSEVGWQPKFDIKEALIDMKNNS